MKKVKKSKKIKKTRKGKKIKKVKKLKKARKPKKVLRKKVQKKKKVTKVKKTRKKTRAKKLVKRKKPAITRRPKKVVEAPTVTPAPMPVEKVPYTQENAIMCICTKCPIQAESTCAGVKAREIGAMMEKGMPEGMMPPPADLPGLYCSSGFATCTDLDFGKMCVCTVCPVWNKYKLETGTPMGYFCRNGKAM